MVTDPSILIESMPVQNSISLSEEKYMVDLQKEIVVFSRRFFGKCIKEIEKPVIMKSLNSAKYFP